jgi:hypothetical protein
MVVAAAAVVAVAAAAVDTHLQFSRISKHNNHLVPVLCYTTI